MDNELTDLLIELWDDIPTVRCGVLDSCANCESAVHLGAPGPSNGIPEVVRDRGAWDGDTEPAFPFDLGDLGGEG